MIERPRRRAKSGLASNLGLALLAIATVGACGTLAGIDDYTIGEC